MYAKTAVETRVLRCSYQSARIPLGSSTGETVCAIVHIVMLSGTSARHILDMLFANVGQLHTNTTPTAAQESMLTNAINTIIPRAGRGIFLNPGIRSWFSLALLSNLVRHWRILFIMTGLNSALGSLNN